MVRVRQIKIEVTKDSTEALKKKVLDKLKIKDKDLKNIKIIKKSIDARDKRNVLYSYEVDVSVTNEDKILKRIKSNDILKAPKEEYILPSCGKEVLEHRPVVVGSGPCGLFCALILAESGYRPIVIERGEKVEERVKTISEFWETGKLNTNSNVCFGEGGAGTFSDGKLNTLVSDENNRIKKVFETFVENGAPEEITYVNKPHIGTDILRSVIINLRNKIISLGGEFYYNTCLTDFTINDGKIEKITINDKDTIICDVLVLALGHSARDTINMLYNRHLNMESKSFAVGLRVQHKQDTINESQYGNYKNVLPPASYKLTHKAKDGRGVYTFCMCPGGYVVNSSCEEGHLIINGMSNYKRDGENANSAVVVTVTKEDFGNHPLGGMEYQRKLEELAYRKGDGKIPVQLWKDYKKNTSSNKFGNINPEFKGSYSFANLNEIFPYYINESLKEGIEAMGQKISGFSDDDVILAGVETRTSSAVRILRDDKFLSNIKGIYPAGEGAGYSGGITTSAVDGIKVAEEIIKKYTNESLN